MWLYRTSRDASRLIALYEYTETREGDHPPLKNFSKGFRAGFTRMVTPVIATFPA